MTPLLSELVEQFWRSWRIGRAKVGSGIFAAFLAGLPSRGREIYDKLPYNFS
jgi:hypothetical protein